jgi:hypothetical protein
MFFEACMVKLQLKSILIVPALVFLFVAPALSAIIPDDSEAAHEIAATTGQKQLRYHLATLPSTNKKRVDAMCVKFLTLIPKAMLIPRTVDSSVYRLISGTFDSIESARRHKTGLMQFCESPFVLKTDQGYTVIAGSQLSEALALAEQKRLEGKNVSTTILELRLPLKHWQMKSTESFSIRDAVIMASRLAAIGVITTIEPSSQKNNL